MCPGAVPLCTTMLSPSPTPCSACVDSGRWLRSSPELASTSTRFRRSAIKVRVEYLVGSRVRHFYEYGVPIEFVSLQPFDGLPSCTIARVAYFHQEHMDMSGLVLVRGLKLRHDDQFISIADIENTPITLNKVRSCDPAGWSDSRGAFVALEF